MFKSFFVTFVICYCALLELPCVVCLRKDYCDQKLCGSSIHTACKNSGVSWKIKYMEKFWKWFSNRQRFSSKCAFDIKIMRFSDEEKDLIVQMHNYHRSRIANGEVYSYLSVRAKHGLFYGFLLTSHCREKLVIFQMPLEWWSLWELQFFYLDWNSIVSPL